MWRPWNPINDESRHTQTHQQMIRIKRKTGVFAIELGGGNETPVWFHALNNQPPTKRSSHDVFKRETSKNIKFHLSKIGLTFVGYYFENWTTVNTLRDLKSVRNDKKRRIVE